MACLKKLQPLVLLPPPSPPQPAAHAWRSPPVRRGPGRSDGRSRTSRLYALRVFMRLPANALSIFGQIGPKQNGFWIPVDSQKIRADAGDTPRPALPHRTTARKGPGHFAKRISVLPFPAAGTGSAPGLRGLDPCPRGRDPPDLRHDRSHGKGGSWRPSTGFTRRPFGGGQARIPPSSTRHEAGTIKRFAPVAHIRGS